ncbi:hypothetical protein JXO52_13440 [bacterium]|nr:hypothetical protein [bacterium]
MPIYEETYESWQGRPESRPNTWWVIGKTGSRLLWTKGMIFFLFLSLIPFFVRAVQIYIVTKIGSNAAVLAEAVPDFQINPGFFLGFLQGQMIYLMLILVFAGTGLIAKDKKFNAFSLYFSKPVNLADYLGGKFLIIAVYGSLITILPGCLLFILRLLFAQDSLFFKTYYWLPLSMLGSVMIILICLGLLALACSALAKGFRSAAILFFGIITFPEMVRVIFPGIRLIRLLSIQANLRQVTAYLFALEKPYESAGWLSALMLVLTVAGSLLILKWKVKPVEVIA